MRIILDENTPIKPSKIDLTKLEIDSRIPRYMISRGDYTPIKPRLIELKAFVIECRSLTAKEAKQRYNELVKMLRIILTGQETGINIWSITAMLGAKEVANRIKNFIDFMDAQEMKNDTN